MKFRPNQVNRCREFAQTRFTGWTDRQINRQLYASPVAKINCKKKKSKSYAHIVTHALHLVGEYGN